MGFASGANRADWYVGGLFDEEIETAFSITECSSDEYPFLRENNPLVYGLLMTFSLHENNNAYYMINGSAR